MPRAEGYAVARIDRLAVATVRVDVQLDRNASFEQRVIKLDSLHGVRRVVFASAGEKRRRGIRGRGDIHPAGPSRIDQANEIGPATRLFDRIRRFRLAAVKADVRQRGQSASGGEAEEADA